MPNRILVWTLGALAAILVLIPLLGMFGMMGTSWMMDGGMMLGTSIAGAVWFLMGILIILALVMVLIEDTTHA